MTRGDFYIGIGPDARWIGSISHDAYPDVIPCDIITAINPIMFEEKVLDFLENDNVFKAIIICCLTASSPSEQCISLKSLGLLLVSLNWGIAI